MIQPSNVFKDNLAQLPAIDGVERIDLIDGKGAVVADIENKPGKQGSLAVYHYLQQAFGTLDAKAAEHGLAVFAEHTADARNRPGRTRTSTACWRSRQGGSAAHQRCRQGLSVFAAGCGADCSASARTVHRVRVFDIRLPGCFRPSHGSLRRLGFSGLVPHLGLRVGFSISSGDQCLRRQRNQEQDQCVDHGRRDHAIRESVRWAAVVDP